MSRPMLLSNMQMRIEPKANKRDMANSSHFFSIHFAHFTLFAHNPNGNVSMDTPVKPCDDKRELAIQVY